MAATVSHAERIASERKNNCTQHRFLQGHHGSQMGQVDSKGTGLFRTRLPTNDETYQNVGSDLHDNMSEWKTLRPLNAKINFNHQMPQAGQKLVFLVCTNKKRQQPHQNFQAEMFPSSWKARKGAPGVCIPDALAFPKRTPSSAKRCWQGPTFPGYFVAFNPNHWNKKFLIEAYWIQARRGCLLATAQLTLFLVLFIQDKLIIGNKLSNGVKCAVWWRVSCGKTCPGSQAVYLWRSTSNVWISPDQRWSYSRLLAIIVRRHVPNNHRETSPSCPGKENPAHSCFLASFWAHNTATQLVVCTNQVILVDVWSCLVDVIEKWYCLLNRKFSAWILTQAALVWISWCSLWAMLIFHSKRLWISTCVLFLAHTRQ